MPMEPVIPGRAPARIPQTTPKRVQSRAAGWRATGIPAANPSSISAPRGVLGEGGPLAPW